MVDLQNITSTVSLNRKINVKAKELTTDIDKNILAILVNEFEGKFMKEGYVEKDTIKVLSSGFLETELIRFKGDVKVNVEFTAKVINPAKNSIISCEIKKINNFGIMALAGPLNILIPNEDNNKFKIDEIIKVRIIKADLILNKSLINIYADIHNETDKKQRAPSEKSIDEKVIEEVTSDIDDEDGKDIELDEDIVDTDDEETVDTDDEEEIAKREVGIDDVDTDNEEVNTDDEEKVDVDENEKEIENKNKILD